MLVIAQGGDAAQPPGSSFQSLVFLGAGFLFLFYFIVLAPERRKKAEEEKMMAGLKKNDRVVTIGGIHGIVAAIGQENDVVTLRVDEGGSTRMKFNRSAIARIITPKDTENKDKSADEEAKK